MTIARWRLALWVAGLVVAGAGVMTQDRVTVWLAIVLLIAAAGTRLAERRRQP